jgi:hypothetical protein
MFWRRFAMNLYSRGRALKTTARLSLGTMVISRLMPFT